MPWLVRVRAFCLLGNKACRDGSNDAGGRQYFLPIVWTIRNKIVSLSPNSKDMMTTRRYPVGIQTFSEIIRGGKPHAVPQGDAGVLCAAQGFRPLPALLFHHGHHQVLAAEHLLDHQ